MIIRAYKTQFPQEVFGTLHVWVRHLEALQRECVTDFLTIAFW